MTQSSFSALSESELNHHFNNSNTRMNSPSTRTDITGTNDSPIGTTTTTAASQHRTSNSSLSMKSHLETTLHQQFRLKIRSLIQLQLRRQGFREYLRNKIVSLERNVEKSLGKIEDLLERGQDANSSNNNDTAGSSNQEEEASADEETSSQQQLHQTAKQLHEELHNLSEDIFKYKDYMYLMDLRVNQLSQRVSQFPERHFSANDLMSQDDSIVTVSDTDSNNDAMEPSSHDLTKDLPSELRDSLTLMPHSLGVMIDRSNRDSRHKLQSLSARLRNLELQLGRLDMEYHYNLASEYRGI